VSVELFTTQNVGKKWTFEFRESTRKLGLKMTNRTHTDERKMVICNFIIWCLVVLYLCLYDIYQSEYVSMVRWVSTREVALYFGFEGAVMWPYMIFLVHSQKSSRICDQLVVNFEPCLGSIVDCVNVNPAHAWHLNHALRDAQNMCALTKVGTVLNNHSIWNISFFKKNS